MHFCLGKLRSLPNDGQVLAATAIDRGVRTGCLTVTGEIIRAPSNTTITADQGLDILGYERLRLVDVMKQKGGHRDILMHLGINGARELRTFVLFYGFAVKVTPVSQKSQERRGSDKLS